MPIETQEATAHPCPSCDNNLVAFYDWIVQGWDDHPTVRPRSHSCLACGWSTTDPAHFERPPV